MADRDNKINALRARLLSSVGAQMWDQGKASTKISKASMADLLCVDEHDPPVFTVVAMASAEALERLQRRGKQTTIAFVNDHCVFTMADTRQQDAAAVFAHWQKRTGRTRTRPNAKRTGHIMARLREGYTVVELARAIDAMCESPFHAGENDRGAQYLEIEHAMRTSDIVERHLSADPKRAVRKQPSGPATPSWDEVVQQQARRRRK